MPMGWVFNCAGYCSVSTPSPVPAFLVDRVNFGSNVLWVGWHFYCATQVPVRLASSDLISPQRLRSPLLIHGHFSNPRSLTHP